MLKRIIWTLLPACGAGLLSFAPFLYLLLTRKARKDRGLFAAFAGATAVEIVMLILVGMDTVEGIPDFLGGVYIVTLMIVTAILTWIEMKPGKQVGALPGSAYL